MTAAATLLAQARFDAAGSPWKTMSTCTGTRWHDECQQYLRGLTPPAHVVARCIQVGLATDSILVHLFPRQGVGRQIP